MSKVVIEDRVYRSKAGFFHVWKLKNTYGIYNDSGLLVASVVRPMDHVDQSRAIEMASLAADAFETRFQR